MTERYMVDDAGSLIDMQTRDTYDYVSKICPVLNKQEEKIKRLEKSRTKWKALAQNFIAFNQCYEKAINDVCDNETITKIEMKYAEYENKVEIK